MFSTFVTDKTDNDTDLSHFVLHSFIIACASSFQSLTCNLFPVHRLGLVYGVLLFFFLCVYFLHDPIIK